MWRKVDSTVPTRPNAAGARERHRPAETLHPIQLLIASVISLLANAGAAHANMPASLSARAARTLRATDTAHLHYLKSSGSILIEEGEAKGTLPGTMHARCGLGASVTANFTIYTSGGSITGHGTATPHDSGLYQSFAGKLVVTSGTGRYRHAHGTAGLYGTFNRHTYALVVQTTGSLSY